jgi:hypothetical protein
MRYVVLILALWSCTATVAEQDNIKEPKKDLYADKFELMMSRSQKSGNVAAIITTKADKAVEKKVDVTSKKIEVLKQEVKTLHTENEKLSHSINDVGVPYEFLQLGDSSVSNKEGIR